MKLLITLIGLVFIIEGLPYVTFPEAMKRWLQQIMDMSPAQLRVMGIVAMGFGLLLVYITQRTSLFG